LAGRFWLEYCVPGWQNKLTMNTTQTAAPSAETEAEFGVAVAEAAPLLPLSAEEFAELDTILDALRERNRTAPCWEFCEGFLAALICCRRPIPEAEYLPRLLGQPGLSEAGGFAEVTQQQAFLALWRRRWQTVCQALDHPVTTLDEPGAYQPEVRDARAEHVALPEAGRAACQGLPLPSFGQRWAQGFMAVVQAWPQDWAGPRNKAASHWRATTLDMIQQLTKDDTEPPTLSAFADEDGPPTVSMPRMKAFADAIWAVYNMRQTWRRLGPRIETVVKPPSPGRNEPCSCGSGKKYKKCCGA
jgi:uncharacterized protein